MKLLLATLLLVGCSGGNPPEFTFGVGRFGADTSFRSSGSGGGAGGHGNQESNSTYSHDVSYSSERTTDAWVEIMIPLGSSKSRGVIDRNYSIDYPLPPIVLETEEEDEEEDLSDKAFTFLGNLTEIGLGIVVVALLVMCWIFRDRIKNKLPFLKDKESEPPAK